MKTSIFLNSCLLLLLISAILTACHGKSASLDAEYAYSAPLSPPEALAQAASPGSYLDIPFPADESIAPSTDALRQSAGTEVMVRDGAQTWKQGGEIVDMSPQLILDPSANEISWAVYQFSGMADGDTITDVTIEVPSPGPDDYYLGWADYNSDAWIWRRRGDKTTSTSVDDVFDPPAGVNPISYHGNAQVAVVAWNALPVRIYSVTLTAELKDVPVAVVFADPSIGNQDLNVEFNASLSHVRGGGAITDYEWDWDGPVNGWSFESTGTTAVVQHMYTEPGTCRAVLRVTGGAGSHDQGTAGVTVSGWINTFGGSELDRANAIATDEHGNIYLTGIRQPSTFKSDVILLKYNRNHDLIWRSFFSGPGLESDEGRVLAVANGYVYVAGETASWDNGNLNLLLLKYTAGGDLVWARTWAGADWDVCGGIALSENGYLYVAGHTWSFGNDAQALLLKYSTDGDLIWARTWGNSGYEYIHGMAAYGSDTIYLAGESDIGGLTDVLLLRMNTDGAEVWARTWGGAEWEGAFAISLDLTGDIYLAGGTVTFAVDAPPNVLALKFSADGTMQWAKTWGTTEPAMGLSVVAGGAIPGAVYFGGLKTISDIRYPLLLKFKTDGSFQWHRTWLSATSDVDFDGFLGLGASPNGLLLMAGHSERAMGNWSTLDPQWVPSYSDAAVAVSATSELVTGTVGAPNDYIEGPLAGVEDTGGGDQDALLLEFYPNEW